MFAVPMEQVARLHASSGTTGKQIVVGYTQNDLDIWGDIVARQLAAAGVTKSDKVDAPLIDQLPMAIECRMKSFNESTCELVAEIVNISVDESVLNDNGKVDPAKLRPIIYDGMNHDYYEFGKKVGKAFSDGKKLL